MNDTYWEPYSLPRHRLPEPTGGFADRCVIGSSPSVLPAVPDRSSEWLIFNQPLNPNLGIVDRKSTAFRPLNSTRGRTTRPPACGAARARPLWRRPAHGRVRRGGPVHGHGHHEHHRFDDGVHLPRDGHHDDEDLLFHHLQRGPGLHLRPRQHAGRSDRGRRVQPLADRRPAARPPDLGPGNPARRDRGRRRHRPQRPLPGRHAHARAHLHQAGLLPGRADGLRRRHRPCGGGGRHGAGRLRGRGHGDLPRGDARAPGQDQGARRGRGRGVEADARQLPHAPRQLRRFSGPHQRRRRGARRDSRR